MYRYMSLCLFVRNVCQQVSYQEKDQFDKKLRVWLQLPSNRRAPTFSDILKIGAEGDFWNSFDYCILTRRFEIWIYEMILVGVKSKEIKLALFFLGALQGCVEESGEHKRRAQVSGVVLGFNAIYPGKRQTAPIRLGSRERGADVRWWSQGNKQYYQTL